MDLGDAASCKRTNCKPQKCEGGKG